MSVEPSLQVSAIPAFADNYLWLIHDGQHAVVVDPGDATPVEAALTSGKLKLAAILLTHHHADHAGGVADLLRHRNIPVYGPARERIAGITHSLSDGEVIDIAKPQIQLDVLDVPGHTAGHIAYVAHDQGWLFCGDTLFAGGCGRLFEGTPEQMTRSLAKLAALPDDTKVYCAHEYTVSNLRFAVAAEPGNHAISERLHQAQAARERGEATVPSTIGIEKLTNPFLRYRESVIAETLIAQGRLGTQSDSHGESASDYSVATFAALREWKNAFR